MATIKDLVNGNYPEGVEFNNHELVTILDHFLGMNYDEYEILTEIIDEAKKMAINNAGIHAAAKPNVPNDGEWAIKARMWTYLDHLIGAIIQASEYNNTTDITTYNKSYYPEVE